MSLSVRLSSATRAAVGVHERPQRAVTSHMFPTREKLQPREICAGG